MRGFLLLMSLLFGILNAAAQLIVKPSEKGNDNYILVNSDILYVTNDVKLQKNKTAGSEASIYLRGEAQLIQGHNQNLKNSGTGTISIFQEGTTNAYDYNYWASPISAPENDLFGISLLHAPLGILKSMPAKIFAELDGSANPLSISNRWIYTFTGTGYSSWNYIGSSTAIAPGYGFTMKGTNGTDPTLIDGEANNSGSAQRYDFRGRPNSGTIEIPISPETFVLVGNPYPSALDLSLFLLENSGAGSFKTICYGEINRRNAITGVAYFWDSKENGSSHYLDDYEGGYGAFSPIDPCTTGVYEKPLFKAANSGNYTGSSGNHYERRFVPVAQGFMVQGVDSKNLQFKNSQRIFRKEGHHSHFKQAGKKNKAAPGKDLEVVPKLQLLVNFNNEYVRSLSLAFWASATSGIDAGMDAIAFNLAPADAGWLQENGSYVIDVRPFDITTEVPLFLVVDKEDMEITFSAGDFENLSLQNLYILDTETNIYNSIKEAPFSMNLAPGSYHGRFKLAFAEKISLTALPEELILEEDRVKDVSIFQNKYLGEVEILANSSAPVKSVALFDLQGKRLFFRSNFDNRRSIGISTRQLANAIYIIKVTNMNNLKTTRKIIVLN